MDIVLEKISKSFYTKDKVKTVYNDFSCKLEGNNIHVLCGENGSGKTTLLKLIKGIITEDTGSISLNGASTSSTKRLLNSALKIQMQFDRGSWPFLTFKENLNWFLINAGLSKKVALSLSEELTSQFGLSNFTERFYKDCNRGTRQILTALSVLAVPQAETVLLDEPFSFLDKANIECMVKYLKSLKNKNIIFTTQDSYKDFFKDFNLIEVGKVK